MKVSLRDLFWLILLGATLTVLIVEHRKAAKEIAECRQRSFFLRIDRKLEPSDAALKRKVATRRFARMTDEQLDACLASTLVAQYRDQSEYEPCLVEMARRGLAHRLQRHYDAMMTNFCDRDSFPRFPANLELLTALRRAQRKPDPLILFVELNSRPPWRAGYEGPCLQATVQNCDVGEEAAFFLDGCDDRGGRRERWRLALIDERGQQIADSNYWPMMGGGVGGFGALQFGEAGSGFNFLELRKYIAPPPSGRYQLQAFYHNSIAIANEADTSSLIVSKSEPISVIVDNPSPLVAQQRRTDSRRPLSVVTACAVLTLATAISRIWSSSWKLIPISFRDLIWCALLVSMAIGMWLDQRHQSKLIIDVRPDAAAEWSIRLDDGHNP